MRPAPIRRPVTPMGALGLIALWWAVGLANGGALAWWGGPHG